MADEQVLDEQVEQVDTEEQAVEAGDAEGGDEPAPEAQPEAGEIQVTIGEEPEAEAKAPAWVKEVRKRNRELEREIRELRRRSETGKVPELGPKPTLEAHDYDSDKYQAALEKWLADKKAVDDRKAAADAEAQSAEEAWKGKIGKYSQAKEALGASDFEDAEAVVTDVLSQVQQGIIVSGAKDPALVVYALGKNEAKVRELAAIKDPVEFAFAVARLEGQMKVTGKRPPAPEERIGGGLRPAGVSSANLDRLRAEAEKTGDYTKYYAEKRKLRK